jgi:hypothetical protein
MIAMLMRNKDGIQATGINPTGFDTRQGVTHG